MALSNSEFANLAFVDPKMKSREDIAKKTGLKLKSVSSRISKLRKSMISLGYEEKDLRQLPIR